MNRFMKIGCAALALAVAMPAFADDVEEGAVGWTPIAVGLASPVQLPWGHARWDVFGLDVNVLYTGAPKIYGLGVGGLGVYNADDAAGIVASGICNWADKNVYGIRATAIANVCQGNVYGIEAGFVGYRKEFWGLDAALLGALHKRLLRLHRIQIRHCESIHHNLLYPLCTYMRLLLSVLSFYLSSLISLIISCTYFTLAS